MTRRYVTKGWIEDDCYIADASVISGHSLTVYEADTNHADTGLVDQLGRAILVDYTPDPIGFVWL